MATLTYIYDTLCGWCFIARPAIVELHETLPEQVVFRSLHAHLFTNDHPFPIDENTTRMVREAGQKIGPARTGARMSDAYISFLGTPGLVYQSDLSARAAAVAEALDSPRSFAFEMA